MHELSPYTQLVEAEIQQLNFPLSPKNLYDPLRYFMSIGGKRIRPILTMLAAELFDLEGKKALNAALAVEIFHNFTLIHDDIMDEAPLRRNKETVHRKWNSNVAILSGDALFVKAFDLIAKQEQGDVCHLMSVFNKTAIEVCEGQQMDMDFEKMDSVNVEQYLEMIRLKTSVLLGCALEMGAITSGTTIENRKLIYDFGLYLGIAFQIQDDILDVYADPEKFGKQVGGDILANKKTLLYLKAKELANEQQQEELRIQLHNSDSFEKVLKTTQLLTDTGAKDATVGIMKDFHSKAMYALESITVPEINKQPLKKLASYLLVREI